MEYDPKILRCIPRYNIHHASSGGQSKGWELGASVPLRTSLLVGTTCMCYTVLPWSNVPWFLHEGENIYPAELSYSRSAFVGYQSSGHHYASSSDAVAASVNPHEHELTALAVARLHIHKGVCGALQARTISVIAFVRIGFCETTHLGREGTHVPGIRFPLFLSP